MTSMLRTLGPKFRSQLVICGATLGFLVTGCRLVEGTPGNLDAGVKRKWFTPVSVPGADNWNVWFGPPVVANGLVLAAVPSGMVALDAETGQQRWRAEFGNPSGSSS